MRYRKLDENLDYTFGKGRNNFWVNVPDAPGQAVLTRLKLEQGQWFLDRSEGTPWNTSVLGKYTGDVRDPVIRTRILQTQGVRFLLNYSSSLNRETRGFDVVVVIDTIYGRSQPTKVPL